MNIQNGQNPKKINKLNLGRTDKGAPIQKLWYDIGALNDSPLVYCPLVQYGCQCTIRKDMLNEHLEVCEVRAAYPQFKAETQTPRIAPNASPGKEQVNA